MEQLRFAVLDGFRAWRGAEELALGPPGQRALLWVLLHRAGRPCTRAELVDAVWGAAPPASADNIVRTYVSRLRRVLAPATIRSGPSGYRLHGEYLLDRTSVGEFVDAARRHDREGRGGSAVECLRAAVDLFRGEPVRGEPVRAELFRGEPLAGVPGPLAEALRAQLRSARLTTLADCVEAELRAGAATDLGAAVAEAVADDPMNERLVGLHMTLLYRGGRQAEAIRVFTSTRRLLSEELGVDPTPDLAEVYQRILRGEQGPDRRPVPASPRAGAGTVPAAQPAVVPRQLPADVTLFGGRYDELARLDRALVPDDEGHGVVGPVVVSGMAGVGKTALVVHWAHSRVETFPDGQLYLDLRGYSLGPELSTEAALRLLLDGLAVDAHTVPPGLDAQIGLYKSLTSRRRLLVVLDNARSADRVRPLLPGGPGCRVVVTSRTALIGLVATSGASVLRLSTLAPEEARQILSRALGADRVARAAGTVDALAERCGHLPLALRIVAANLAASPQRSIETYLAQETGERFLESLAVDGDTDVTVRAAFEVSYRELGEEAGRTFRRFGLLPRLRLPAAAVAAMNGSDLQAAQRVLATLAGCHLVEVRGVDDYVLHDLLALYARELARGEGDGGPAPDDSDARDRLFWWYLAAADAAGAAAYPGISRLPRPDPAPSAGPGEELDAESGRRWLEDNLADLVALVLDAAERGPLPVAWHLADRLRGFFHFHRHSRIWELVAEAGLGAAESCRDDGGTAAMLNSLGCAHFSTGDSVRALTHLRRAAELFRRAADAEGEAAALNNLGRVQQSDGDHDAAAQSYGASLRINRTIGNGMHAIQVYNLSVVEEARGDLRRAADLAAEAVAELGVDGSVRSLYALMHDASIRRWTGDLPAAVDALRRLVPRIERVGELDLLATTGIALAEGHRALRHHRAAVAAGRSALATMADSDNERLRAEVCAVTGWACAEAGRPADAERMLHDALAGARRSGTPLVEASALLGISRCAALGQDPSTALRHNREALRIASGHGFRVLVADATIGQARLRRAELLDEETVRLARAALQLYREAGHLWAEGAARQLLGELEHGLGRVDSAHRWWESAARIRSRMGVNDAPRVVV